MSEDGPEGRPQRPGDAVSEDGPDLTGPEADDLLRPAAELAIELAQAGTRLQPPLEVPRGLRPLLGHARLTRAALATARRVIESDAGFRARVAMAVELPGAAVTLGRASVLWLDRPNGWQEELRGLVDEARAAAAVEAEQAEERTAQRRLRHAEEARDRAERAAEEARRAAEAARVDLQEERRLRRAAEEAMAQRERHVASLEEQLRAAARRAEKAAAKVAEQAEASATGTAALAASDAELRELRFELAVLRAAMAEQLSPEPAPPAEPAPAADLAALGGAVAAASSAAVALGAALGRAAAALDPRSPALEDRSGPGSAALGGRSGPGSHPLEGGSGGSPALGAGSAPGLPARPIGADAADGPTAGSGDAAQAARRPATQPRWARSKRRGTRRRPVSLPPFVLDDSPAAAAHLVSLPGVAVLVDGYNVTLSAWPELPLAEQRVRLVDALAELAARTGARPEVVFDGTELLPSPSAGTRGRSLVKVSFTAHDVEADDVIIARAWSLALPVVVASDDKRVRDGARSAGANVLGIAQLLTALRRLPL